MARLVYQTRGLARSYPSGDGRLAALLDVSLRIEEGEHIALTGPSGAGKTTLLELLGLLDADFEGELFFIDEDVRTLSATKRAQRRLEAIGMVYQGFHLLGALDVRDNVALPHWRLHGDARAARRRATDLLHELGLGARLQHRPPQLSVGERQRVAVARALINDPRVVLADEPTGNLDAESTETVLQLFAQIPARGRTLLVVTHDPDVIATTKRIVQLRYGALVGDRSTARAEQASPALKEPPDI